MLSLQFSSNSKLTVIFLFVGLLSFGSMATAKPSWKDGGSTDQPTKGPGKGSGKTKTPISDITIIEHPASLSIISGEKAEFSVSANSSDGQVITYQWYFNESIINGATSAGFAIDSASVLDEGNYSVSLSTLDVTKTTQAALSIEAAPAPSIAAAISLHPVSQSAYIQENLTLNVSATGSGILQYQWRKNGEALLGEVFSYLNFQSLSLNDGAQYDVVITNEAGSVTSNSATLTVNPWASISLDWDTPTAREDGSVLELNEIDSYKLYVSFAGNAFEEAISIPVAMNNFELSDMPPGTYQLAIATTDSTGITGNRSDVVTVIIN